MVSVIASVSGQDKSIKYVFSNSEGHLFECILFTLAREPGKSIICLSTQSGCNMHCSFCETGKLGHCYNLTHDDMFQALSYIMSQNPKANVKWVSLMGMGEPLYNFDNISRFHALVKENYDLTLSLSTCGISPRIMELADSNLNYHLFISLHFSDDTNRSLFMPINKRYNIESVFDSCRYYHERRPNEKIEISYLMLEDINVSRKDLDNLIQLTNKEYYLVQLLFYNSGKNHSNVFRRIPMERANKINQYLIDNGVNSYLSVSAGQDIGGACGQMAASAEPVTERE